MTWGCSGFTHTGRSQPKHIIRPLTSTFSRAWFAMGCPWWLFQEAEWCMKQAFSTSQQDTGSLFRDNLSLSSFTNESSSETRWAHHHSDQCGLLTLGGMFVIYCSWRLHYVSVCLTWSWGVKIDQKRTGTSYFNERNPSRRFADVCVCVCVKVFSTFFFGVGPWATYSPLFRSGSSTPQASRWIKSGVCQRHLWEKVKGSGETLRGKNAVQGDRKWGTQVRSGRIFKLPLEAASS